MCPCARLGRSDCRSRRVECCGRLLVRLTTRNLVIVTADGSRFEPIEVRIGPEVGGEMVILSRLEERQNVVAFGQFLIDSEASLGGGVLARLNSADATAPKA